jgi:hypothetical protein
MNPEEDSPDKRLDYALAIGFAKRPLDISEIERLLAVLEREERDIPEGDKKPREPNVS